MHNLTRYDPFAETGFDELFRGFFRPVRIEKEPPAIKMDVSEKGNAYVVKAEIPGVAKEDIQVAIEGNRLAIGAEVKRETEEKGGERICDASATTAAPIGRSLFRPTSTTAPAAPGTTTACSSSRSRRSPRWRDAS